jgi:hypothetical protein
MRFSTDEGRFGFVVTPVTESGMFKFQVVIDGQLVGDSDPCFLGSAMDRLGNLHRLDDKRLASLPVDPDFVLSVLRSDEALHDAAVLSIAESLDSWLVCGYVYEGNVVMLAQIYEEGTLAGPILVSVVASPEYDLIYGAVRTYWSKSLRGDSAPH